MKVSRQILTALYRQLELLTGRGGELFSPVVQRCALLHSPGIPICQVGHTPGHRTFHLVPDDMFAGGAGREKSNGCGYRVADHGHFSRARDLRHERPDLDVAVADLVAMILKADATFSTFCRLRNADGRERDAVHATLAAYAYITGESTRLIKS